MRCQAWIPDVDEAMPTCAECRPAPQAAPVKTVRQSPYGDLPEELQEQISRALLRYGVEYNGQRSLRHLTACMIFITKICTCGLLNDLMPVPDAQVRVLYPHFDLEFMNHMEAVDRAWKTA